MLKSAAFGHFDPVKDLKSRSLIDAVSAVWLSTRQEG
jgi:hypothetical protein